MNTQVEPLVSVVVPTCNRAHCIGRALASVASQTYPAIEIIVVDDGSTDDTVAAIGRLNCPRPLRVIQLDGNHGASAARNEGIAAATGEYVAFLDSDDAWHPRKIELQIDRLRRLGPDYGACYTRIVTYDDRHRVSWVSQATDEGDFRGLLTSWNLVGSTSCFLAKQKLLQDVGGFNTSLRSCQDWDLWCRLAEITRFACAGELLTALSVASHGRITSSARGRLSGHLFMYRTHLRRHF